jgi:hypothetical protein
MDRQARSSKGLRHVQACSTALLPPQAGQWPQSCKRIIIACQNVHRKELCQGPACQAVAAHPCNCCPLRAVHSSTCPQFMSDPGCNMGAALQPRAAVLGFFNIITVLHPNTPTSSYLVVC